MRLGIAAVATLLIGLVGTAAPAWAEGHKSIKDWTGVCDNVGDCTAFGFTAEEDDSQGYLKLTREAGGKAQTRITLVHRVDAASAGGLWSLAVDGKPLAGVTPLRATGGPETESAVLPPAAVAAVVQAIRGGAGLQVQRDSQPAMTISLSGAAAMLLWLDDQQGRVGTVTALSQKGMKPASKVPPPKPPPSLAVAPPASQAGMPSLPVALLASMAAKIDDCARDLDQADAAVVARLAPGVVLWGPQCEQAVYNNLNVFFIGDEQGGNLHRISFPESPGSDSTTDDELMNVDFDAKTQTLSSLSKARGIGDCGAEADWVWDGQAFQLLHETLMPQCRGVTPDDWPTLYVARRR